MKKEIKTYYTYVDYTQDTNEPFYVGKGNILRVNSLTRNLHHKNITKKHGCDRKIVFETNQESEAFDQEIKLIKELHTFVDDPFYNGIGCNHTPGGEGHSPTEKDRLRRSENLQKRWEDETKRHDLVKSMKDGLNGKHKSESWRLIKSEQMQGSGNPNWGRQLPIETRNKISKSKQGTCPWNKGLKTPKKTTELRQKEIRIHTSDSRELVFSSHREAAQYVACKLNKSEHTVRTWFVARKKCMYDFKFVYC